MERFLLLYNAHIRQIYRAPNILKFFFNFYSKSGKTHEILNLQYSTDDFDLINVILVNSIIIQCSKHFEN